MSNSNTKYEFKGTKSPLVIWGDSIYTGDNIQTTAGTISGKNLQKVAECDRSELEDDEECIHNLELFAAAPSLLSALMDVNDPKGCTVAECLRELKKFVNPEEVWWIKWCDEQADKIQAAIEQALNIKP